MINQIRKILFQIGWPISINNTTKYSLLINSTLLEFHEKKIDDIINYNLDFLKEYNVSDMYSLYFLLKFIIEYLWEEEFSTVTWLDLYKDGYGILKTIKKEILIWK